MYNSSEEPLFHHFVHRGKRRVIPTGNIYLALKAVSLKRQLMKVDEIHCYIRHVMPCF